MNSQRKRVSRRDFLGLTAALGSALPFTNLAQAALPVRHMPASSTIHVFSKHLEWLGYTALAETVAETGFDGIDLTVRPNGHVVPERVADDLPKAVEAAKKAGLQVLMMTTAITSARDPHTEPILKAASALGIQYYRLGYLSYEAALEPEQSLKKAALQLKELAELNKTYRIHGAYQNHAGTWLGGPVWDLWLALRELDPQWIGCQYDIRHAVVEGAQSWPLGLQLLKRYIKTTDIKDVKWVQKEGKWRPETVPLGEGMVDFGKYFELVKQYGLSGPISLHYEYPLVDGADKTLSEAQKRRQAVTVMQKDLKKLRSMLTEAGL